MIKLSELQAAIEYVMAHLPRESLDHWSEHDKARVTIDNATPALLEIAEAALAVQDVSCSCRACRGLSETRYGNECALSNAEEALRVALDKVEP